MSKKKSPLHHKKQTKNPPALVTNTLWQHQMPTTTTKNGTRRYTGENVHCGFFACLFCFKETTQRDTISAGTQFYHIHY